MKANARLVYLFLLVATVCLASPGASAVEVLEPGGLKFEYAGDGKTKVFDVEFEVGTFTPAIQAIRICCRSVSRAGAAPSGKAVVNITDLASAPKVVAAELYVPSCWKVERKDGKDSAAKNRISIRVELKLPIRATHTLTISVNGMRSLGKKGWSIVSLAPFPQPRVAIVYDIDGRSDMSLNDMAFLGALWVTHEFQAEIVEARSETAANYLPTLRNLARTGDFDVIIGIGFLLGDALGTVAAEFPDQKFGIIDVDWITGPNIMNVVFRENEMSALIGCLAAMAAADYGYASAGVVLGIAIPVLFHYEVGFRFGMDWGLAKYAELTGTEVDVSMLYNYTGTFSDMALGKAASETMLALDAIGIYNAAGPLGVSAHEAVVEAHYADGTTYGPPYYFGVDANQDWWGGGKHALASGMKRIDAGVHSIVKAVVEGTFRGGVVSLGLAEGGVGISSYWDLIDFIEFGVEASQITDTQAARELIVANWTANRETVPLWIWTAIDELEAAILNESIIVPTADSDGEIDAIREQYPLN